MPRRDFIKISALASGAAAGLLPFSSYSSPEGMSISETCAELDTILEKPVLDRSIFPDPVIFESLELLRDRRSFICRVRSKDGAEGISLSHPRISSVGYPVFNAVLQKHFIGNDARDSDQLIFKACHSNLKYQGVPTKMEIMIDANGSYSVKEAIRIGKILEEYNYYFYEAPLPWDWHDEMKPVQAALSIPIDGGEIENRMHSFRWQIANKTLQIVQPDIFYFGGMIRSIKVARMAEAAGMTISPHLSSGLGCLHMLHMLSAAPAVDRFHEFKMFTRHDANGTLMPVESKTEPIQSIHGVIKVPTGSGLWIHIDPDYINKHNIVTNSFKKGR